MAQTEREIALAAELAEATARADSATDRATAAETLAEALVSATEGLLGKLDSALAGITMAAEELRLHPNESSFSRLDSHLGIARTAVDRARERFGTS